MTRDLRELIWRNSLIFQILCHWLLQVKKCFIFNLEKDIKNLVLEKHMQILHLLIIYSQQRLFIFRAD